MKIKRTLDVLIATVAIILSSLFWLVIAILIKIESDGPVFFRQVRPGPRGRKYLEEHFSRRICTGEIARILSETAGMHRERMAKPS
jgi:hypothetical protein